MSEIGEAAVDYVRRGLAVIALQPRKKAPSFRNGLKDATTHAGDVEAWWNMYPTDNVAIVTGRVSGNIGVIDIDIDDDCGKDGYEFLRKWEREHGPLPDTWTVTTARGGQHMYYRFDGEVPRNTANEELAIDFRGEGGYVMAPPSVHPNGNVVEWDFHPDDYDLAWADDNVLAFLDAVRPKGMQNSAGKFELPEHVSKGGRNQAMFKYCSSLQSRGLGDREIRMLAHAANQERFEPPMDADEVDRCVDSALGYDKGDSRKPKHIEVRHGKAVLDVGTNGNVLQTCTNATKAVMADERLSGRFRHDQLADSVMVTLPLPWDGGTGDRPLTDADYVALHTYLEDNYRLTKKQNAIDAVTNASRANAYNPLTDWLSSLVWDGTERMDMLLPAFLGAEPSDYNVAVTRVALFGAVARAYRPGTKVDNMPILVGRQGLGKSFFLRTLACGDQWYSDNLNTIEGDKGMEKLAGMWIVEMAELLATKKAKEVEAIKAFITSTSDYYRKPYERIAAQRPRTCTFWGTTNSKSFLNDKTGNRRFLPVVCGVNEPYMSCWDKGSHAYMEQVWAEAVHRWHNEKPSLTLDDSVQDAALRQQESFAEDDPRVGIIEEYLETRLVIGVTQSAVDRRVCTQEIMSECLHVEQGTAFYLTLVRDVVQIMDDMPGWKRLEKKAKTRNYGTQRCWVPDDEPDSVAAWVAALNANGNHK